MSQPAPQSARIHVERMMYRNSIAVPGETAASYALLTLIPSGGAPGLRLGPDEVAKNAGPGRLAQVVVLTDGETTGEQNCRELAREAARHKTHLTLMGVGTEWNASLLKDLAKLSEGKWYYIDVNQAQEAQRVFLQEFEHLAATGFTNVELHLWPVKDVKVKRVRQVVPEIKELP